MAFVDFLLDNTTADIVSRSLDFEGNNMGRDGTFSQATVNLAVGGHTFHLDVTVLGEQLFHTPGSKGFTLRHILEDPTFKLLFFDVRQDSDVIFSKYSIIMDGVLGLQLMAVAYSALACGSSGDHYFHLPGLAKCIDATIGIAVDTDEMIQWHKEKRDGRAYCDKHTWAVYNEKPLPDILKRYAAGDVIYMPHLYATYYDELQHYPDLMDWVVRESGLRVLQSTMQDYDSKCLMHRRVPQSFIDLPDSAFSRVCLH